MSSDQEKKDNNWLSEGLIAAASEGFIVAAISVTAYLFTFVYEAGFAKVFGIPLSFVTVGLTDVFIAGGSLLLAGLLVLTVGNLAFMVSAKFGGPIWRRIVSLTPMFLCSIALFFFVAGTRLQEALTGLIGAWLMILLFEFGFPLLTQRHKNGYREKLRAQDKLDARTMDVPGYLAKRLGSRLYSIIYTLMLTLFVIYYAGQSAALRQSRFLVASTSPEMVVLRVYGDKIICVPFNRDTRQVEQSFVVLRMAQDPDLMLRPEDIGPFNVKGHKASGTGDSPTATPIPPAMLTPQPDG